MMLYFVLEIKNIEIFILFISYNYQYIHSH